MTGIRCATWGTAAAPSGSSPSGSYSSSPSSSGLPGSSSWPESSSASSGPEPEELYVESQEDGATVRMYNPFSGANPNPSIVYSTDRVAWETLGIGNGDGTGATVINLNNGDRVWFRAADGISNSVIHRTIRMSGNCSAGGNVVSLLGGAEMGKDCFAGLFAQNASLITASGLVLPDSVGDESCLMMFYGCTRLRAAPEIPEATPANGCYLSMFGFCGELMSIRVRFNSWGSGNVAPTSYWFESVSSGGLFYCPSVLGTDATISRGADYCPAGWTVVND